MAFDIGIALSKPIEEQLIATLRETLPALREFSNEEIVRRVEPADVLGALGTLRRVPVLHSLNGLVDPDLLEGEATVFGKLHRKLKKGESDFVGSMFSGLEEMLSEAQRREFAKMFDDPQLRALGIESPRIKYPAVVLTPIAIYR